MGHDGDTWLEKARSILAEIAGNSVRCQTPAEHGFAFEMIGELHLLSRRGHAIGVLQKCGAELQFTRAGYAEPTFRTHSSDAMNVHLVEVIASVLQPFDPRK